MTEFKSELIGIFTRNASAENVQTLAEFCDTLSNSESMSDCDTNSCKRAFHIMPGVATDRLLLFISEPERTSEILELIKENARDIGMQDIAFMKDAKGWANVNAQNPEELTYEKL